MSPTDEIERLRTQEEARRFPSMTNSDAIDLGLILYELARKRGLPVAIDVRRGAQQLFHVALKGTTPDNGEWIRRKSNVVQRLHVSSLRAGLERAERGTSLTEVQGLPLIDYATHGGSFPIAVDGVGVVGAVTVSGLPQTDDHALVVEGIDAYLETRRPGPPGPEGA